MALLESDCRARRSRPAAPRQQGRQPRPSLLYQTKDLRPAFAQSREKTDTRLISARPFRPDAHERPSWQRPGTIAGGLDGGPAGDGDEDRHWERSRLQSQTTAISTRQATGFRTLQR